MRRKLLLLKSEMLEGVDLELFSLLEKNEQRQIKLFQLLLEEKGEVSVNNVLTRLSVDRATLKEDLFYLQANLENIKQLEIVIQEGNILLIRHGNIAAVDVYYH
ncbi:TPA: M protein trans-acting positive regulator, partial [Enterococcus faecium]|nr:M protein trans-acting positive regulator [Enterococcus faecium]